MAILVSFVALLCLLWSKRKYGVYFNPISLFVGANTVSVLFAFANPYVGGVSFITSLCICVMFISFCIGCGLGTNRSIEQYREPNYYDIDKVIIIASVIYNIALVFYLDSLFSAYSINEFFLEMNEVNKYVQSDEYETGIFSYLVQLGVPLSLLILFRNKSFPPKKWMYIQYMLCFLHCLSPRRGQLFFMLIVTAFYLYVNTSNKTSVKRNILFTSIAIVAMVIMIVTQSMLGKNSTESLIFAGMPLPSSFNDPYIYTALNYPYIDSINMWDMDFHMPFEATLRLFYKYISNFFHLGIDTTTSFALNFSSWGNMYSNTAPILYYSYLDLNVFFFVDFILLGIVSNRAYYELNSPNIGSRIIGCMVFELLVLSFRGYDVIHLGFILTLIYCLIIKRCFK